MAITKPGHQHQHQIIPIEKQQQLNCENSMSQDYHHSQSNNNNNNNNIIFNNNNNFPNGFERSTGLAQIQSTENHNNNNTKLIIRGFEPTAAVAVGVGGLDPSTTALHPAVYDTAAGGMLSEMFNFEAAHGGGGADSDLLDYHRRSVAGHLGSDWYGGGGVRQVNADSAAAVAAMQLFQTNPPPRSPSPPQQPPPPPRGGGSTLHMFHTLSDPNFWATASGGGGGGVVEGQGLSLSLSSSLQHMEAAKQAEDNHIMFFHDPSSSNTTTSSPGHFFKHLVGTHHHNPQPTLLHNNLQPMGGFGPSSGQTQQVHMGFGSASIITSSSSSSLGVVNAGLRNSKYAKPAQELLEEFCSVGRGHQLKKGKFGRQNSLNPSTSGGGGGDGGGGGGDHGGARWSSSSKDPPQLSAADRIEHQRRKVKLLAMLDEVDRRYNHYCEQMQMVVNSFDLVMGYGAAIPYTALAQKAMSRHFRCLKDAIQAQLKQSCEVLGEKDPTASSGLTKGETPRLKLLEQSLRQQRAFHQMGMMDQEAWRPQRGLPERSVNVLRAWLFEHFLHPYPSDADKHLLARQTGLSRNQVSNWFINARVRLWKPMVEEMYQQEATEADVEEEEEEEESRDHNQTTTTVATTQQQAAQNPKPPPPSSSSEGKRLLADNDPSLLPINNRHHHHHHQPPPPPPQPLARTTTLQPPVSQANFLHSSDNTCQFDGPENVGTTTMIRFGPTSGDVSLTLGLRHAGHAPDKSSAFSVRDFDNC